MYNYDIIFVRIHHIHTYIHIEIFFQSLALKMRIFRQLYIFDISYNDT